MARQYVISAGPGTLIDYGTAAYVVHNSDYVEIVSSTAVVSYPLDDAGIRSDALICVMSEDCEEDCETGR